MSDTRHQIKILRIIGGLDPRFGGPSESSVNACIASQSVDVLNSFVFPTASVSAHHAAATRRRLADAGVEVKVFPTALQRWCRSRDWGISPQLVVWLARHVREYDVVHLHGAWGASQLAGLAACRIASRPCVLTPHESLTSFDVDGSQSSRREALKRALRRLYLDNLSLIVFSSAKECADSLPERCETAVAVIPHPLAELLDSLPPVRKTAPGQPASIGFLGRLHAKKNVDVLIRAVARSSSVMRLEVGGDGPAELRQALDSVAAEVGMTDRVHWRGFVARADRMAFLDSIDVLAMPSAYECFGMAAAEGLARGVPTIVSSDTGLAELITRHRAGIVAPPTVEGFADAIEQLTNQPGMLAELARRGRAAAEAELSMAAHGASQRTRYRVLVDNGRSAQERGHRRRRHSSGYASRLMPSRLAVETEVRSLSRRVGFTPVVHSVRSLLRRGDGYEDAFRDALQQAIGEGDTVWDVGANLGVYTALFCDWVGPRGTVVAFEPTPTCFDVLRRGVGTRDNLRCFQLALGASVATMPMTLAENHEGATHSLAIAGGDLRDVIDVDVLPGDELRHRETLPVPHVIKIDVEGFEPEVIRGLDATLSDERCRAVFCEVHFGLLAARGEKHAPQAIERFLQARRFQTRWIDSSHLGAYRS